MKRAQALELLGLPTTATTRQVERAFHQRWQSLQKQGRDARDAEEKAACWERLQRLQEARELALEEEQGWRSEARVSGKRTKPEFMVQVPADMLDDFAVSVVPLPPKPAPRPVAADDFGLPREAALPRPPPLPAASPATAAPQPAAGPPPPPAPPKVPAAPPTAPVPKPPKAPVLQGPRPSARNHPAQPPPLPAALGEQPTAGPSGRLVPLTRSGEIRAANRARLVVCDGDREMTFPLGESTSLGRSPDNDLAFQSGRLSRYQCRFQRIDGELVVIDMGSTNGTRVNGVAIHRQVLKNGDTISAGRLTMTFLAPDVPQESIDLSGDDARRLWPWLLAAALLLAAAGALLWWWW